MLMTFLTVTVGILGASRTLFAINQDMSYSVAFLMTGTSDAVASIILIRKSGGHWYIQAEFIIGSLFVSHF